MGRFDNIKRRVNDLTGTASRKNYKLRDISDWLVLVSAFLQTYDLSVEKPLGNLLENTGNAKFDLIGIIHNGRPMINKASEFKNFDMPELINNIIEKADAIRRYLINPKLQEEHLIRTLGEFRENYNKLQTIIESCKEN